MSTGYDIYKQTMAKFKNPYQNTYSNPYDQNVLTPAQQQIQGYANQIKAEEKTKTKPLQWIFDRLQTGQYVTANMVDQALKNTKKDDPLMQEIGSVLKAGWQGITGERKGNYKDILVNDLGMKDRKGKIDAADILGFVGDVFLDPTTYVSFGASKMGVSAATQYANDVARVTLRTMGKDQIKKIASKSLDVGKFNKLLNESTDKAMKYLSKQGGDVAREINKIRNLAYKEALKTPAEELRSKMLAMTQPYADKLATERTGAIAEQLGGYATPANAEAALNIAEKPSFIEDLVQAIPTRYGGAGERKVSFLGKEYMKKVRPLNSWERAKEIIGTKINDAVPDKLKDVWWKFNNQGVMGEIRKKLGLRDPYGKLVNLEYMENGTHYHLAKLREYTEAAQAATAGADDATKAIWVRLNDKAEELWTKDNPVTAFDLLEDPITREQFGIKDENVEAIRNLGTNVTKLLNRYRADYMKIAQEGIVKDMNDIRNYLPMTFKDSSLNMSKYFTEMGSSRPSYSMSRSISRGEAGAREAQKLEQFLGLSPAVASQAVRDYNMSGLNMNLDELLQLRGYAQAQVEKRANIIRTFREFGVPIDEVQKATGDMGLKTAGGNINLAGLRSSNEMGLEGLLFDRNVSDIFDRVAASTDPRHVTAMQRAFINFNSWWKGMATMTTGFHARNAVSNNVTGFMVHGTDWFKIQPTLDANAAAIYAMKKADITKSLKEINMSEGMYRRLLNKRYGDYTLKKLADMQLKSGLLSEAQMGIESKNAFEKVLGKSNLNPFSLDFKGRELSQKLGGWIENSAKFKSFLIDYEDILKGTKGMARAEAKATSEAGLKYAERKAKQWWLDYSDLTPFEQKTMKNIIPFYTWLRKNIGNQIEGVLIYPQTFSIFPKIMDAMQYTDPNFDPKSIPAWMMDLGMFPVSMPGTKKGGLLFRPDMPFMDLNKIPLTFEEGRLFPKFDASDFKDDIVNASHPAIKTIASMMTKKGYDFFRKKDLEDDAPAPLFLRFLTKNTKALQTLDGLLRMTGVKGFRPRVDENGKLRMNARWLQFFENNLPIIRNINLMVEAATLPPQVETAVEEATKYKPDYEKADQLFRVLGSITGLKFYPFNETTAKEEEARNLYYEATKRRTADMRRTQASAERRATSRKKTADIIRRMGL